MKKKKIITLVFSLSVFSLSAAQPQINSPQQLFDYLQVLDKEVFEQGFNQCDLSVNARLMTQDLEFYHDNAGPSFGLADFLQSMREGLCKTGKNPIRRELVPGSLKVYPLADGRTLYGAIQTGLHQFPSSDADTPKDIKSAKFTHLWLNTEDGWKISRVLSYDH